MALQIISVVLFTVFFSEALTLMCFNCTDTNIPGTCTQTANCSSSSQCNSVTTSMTTYNVVKSCTAALCVNFSINVGSFGMSSKCCSSDYCNNATASDSENGLSCDTCEGTICTKTLTCKGDEDHCVTAAVQLKGMNLTVKGCTSQHICNNRTIVSSALPSGLIIFSVLCLKANNTLNVTLPVSAATSSFPTFFHLKSGFLLVFFVFGCTVLSM